MTVSNPTIASLFRELWNPDKDRRNSAYLELLDVTRQPVEGAYEYWDELLVWLRDGDNHQRAIAAQLLAQLAVSDPEGRMERDIEPLFEVTRDERFVTARHALQSFWKVGLASPALRARVIERLTGRFEDCMAEKNWSLIRYDIVVSLAKLADATGDKSIREVAARLAEKETDARYRKKYLGALK